MVCTIPAQAAGASAVTLTSNGVTYDPLSLTYSDAATPEVVSLSPANGGIGDSVVISGSKFGIGGTPTVTVRLLFHHVFCLYIALAVSPRHACGRKGLSKL